MNSNKKNPPLRIGILGGGQLARMLALAAHPMGLTPYILSEKNDDPAAQVVSNWIKGNPKNKADINRFIKKVDICTFESEFIDGKMLEQIQTSSKTSIFPEPQLMSVLQDRKTQKAFLETHGLPTSPYFFLNDLDLLEHKLHSNSKKYVIKKCRDGYDGYGTYIIKNQRDLDRFHSIYKSSDCDFIAEEFISFQRELAVICARSRTGQIEFLPFVESLQKDSRCFWVKGPIKESTRFKKIKIQIQRMLRRSQYVGVLGIEFFDTGKELLVNELAPRVHNTGHYSQNTPGESQFDWHLKCLLGQKLTPSPHLSERKLSDVKAFAMVNLLGRSSVSADAINLHTSPDCFLHWYGKKQVRPGRKLGHINSLAENPDQALKTVLKAARKIIL